MSDIKFNLTDVENMGSDFGDEPSYSSILPAYSSMDDPDTWKAYYENLGIDVSKYSKLNDLEKDSNNIYYKFTEAVKADPNSFKKYLGALYNATKNNNTQKYWDNFGTYNHNTNEFTVTENQKNNFAKWYNTARTDGKFGFFHLTPGLQLDDSPFSTQEEIKNSENSEVTKTNQNIPSVNENPYDIISLLETSEERKDVKPWFTPIIAGHTNDWLTAGKVASEKKKGISIPKETAPYKQAVVTNDYFTRSQMEKRAKELEWLAAESGITDEKTKNQYRSHYLQQAQDIRDKALALKQETFNRTSKEANNFADWNRAMAIDADNKKNAKIAAAKLLLANINAQEALSKGTIQSKFITDTANEIRLAEYINKLDKRTREKQNSINGFLLQIDSLIDEYELINNQSPWDDPEFITIINTLAEDHHEGLMGKESIEDKKAYWESIKTSDANVKNAFETFEKKRQRLLDSIVKQISNLRRKQNIKAGETVYVSNTPKIIEDIYDFFKRKHKTGGSVTRAQIQADQSKFNTILRSQDRFHERLYKQQRDANKNTTERLKIAQTNLDKALGRLSQEDMLLLKKLFS